MNKSVNIHTPVNTTYNLDIANCFKESNSTIIENYCAALLKISNIPNIDLVYPYSIHSKKGEEEKRYLNKSYLKKYK